jgi:hypothetical protein
LNFYYCLSPPACQVEEHEASEISSHPSTSRGTGVAPQVPKRPPHQKCKYIIGVDDEELKEGMAKGLIPTTVTNSAATSGIGTINDPCQRTGQPSHKQFILPNRSVIPATKIAEYPFEVRKLAKVLHITPGISRNSLLSTMKFADANYIKVFDKDTVNIYNANDTVIIVTKGAILRGWQDSKSNLCCIPLVRMVRNPNMDTVLSNSTPSEFLLNCPDPTEAVQSVVYELEMQPELVQYLHALAGFPTKPTWLKAIKNKQFASLLGLTTEAVRRHFPHSDETHKGHGRRNPADYNQPSRLKRQSNNKSRSTTKRRTSSPPSRKPCSLKSTISRRKPHTRFGPTRLAVSQNNQAMATNTSWDWLRATAQQLVKPMKNRSAGEMVQAYQAIINCLNVTGIFPKEHILDYECSKLFKQQIKHNKMTYQLVPLHDHRRNQAEKAVHTFKDHFVSILCGMDSSFPLHLWDRLLIQAEHTLNMLRPARMLKTVSAYTYLYGQHDYNSHPFAPPGCKVKAHVVPEICKT